MSEVKPSFQCSFCERENGDADVLIMIAGRTGNICSNCVEECLSVLMRSARKQHATVLRVKAED